MPLAKPTSLPEPTSLKPTDSVQQEWCISQQRVGMVCAALGMFLGIALAGCSSEASKNTFATETSVVSVDSGAVTPATPADDTSEAVVAATPVDKSVVTVEGVVGAAPVAAANQIAGKDLVEVAFDFPDTARPIKEVDQPVADGTKRLALKVSGLTYHGVVCGFSIKGTRPESPVLIRMTGTKADGTGFDSGPISVAWTSTEPPVVSSGGADNNGWNFLSDANPNRSGPGWVVSLGGVTPDGAGSIPKTAACSLEPGVGTFSTANGPIGFWAGFARN